MRSYQTGFSFFKFLLLSVIVGIFLTAFFYIKIKGHSIFPISKIKIASDYHQVSKIQLKKIISLHIKKKNFLTININQLRKALLNTPWIYDVRIQRIWPDTLLIKVEEQKPIALFNEKGIINLKGEIFYPMLKKIPHNLPHLIAPPSELNTLLQHYQKMLLMSKLLKLEIVLLELTQDGSYKVVLNNGAVLLLGKSNIIQRWKRFIAAYPKLFQESVATKRRIGQIDLRYTNGLAVRWRHNLKNQ